MITFEQAFALYGPDVERIAAETGIAPPDVDRLVNGAMTDRYIQRRKDRISEYKRRVGDCERTRRAKDRLREIRSAHA
jgi:hypothetical protein